MTFKTEQLNQHQNHISNYMYLGAVPFLVLSLGPWIEPKLKYIFIDLFLQYSTIILTFLAGSLWAMALFGNLPLKRRHIHTAIIFSIWPLFSHIFSYIPQTTLMMIGFIAVLGWEKLFVNPVYPRWYHELRHRITFIVLACHMFTIFSLMNL